MPRNTTRGTGNAIADPRAGVKREVMELYHRLRHFTRPRQRACTRSRRCVAGEPATSRPTTPCIIDQFRADSRPEIAFPVVEVAPGDRVLSVEKSMAAGIVGTLLLRPGEKGFPSHAATSADQILTGIMTFRRQSFRVINSSCAPAIPAASPR